MHRLALTALLLAAQMTAASAAGPAVDTAGAFAVLCYHEARDEVRDYPDPYAVDSAALVRQFAWLRANGYSPVSLDDIVAARRGGKPLPAKAVLLSFDDAYLSFYTRVYPLLREFRFPAVLGVVGRWIEGGGPAMYGEKGSVPDASFPTWRQIREMADSGLVEIASHTYDLHRGVPANPQGNLQAAASARTYDAPGANYEGDAGWRARVRADFARNADLIERETGRRPRTVVWPYGSYSDELVRLAAEAGMTIGLTLEEGINSPDVPLNALRRVLVAHNPALADFIAELRGPVHPVPVRVVQVSLDDLYSADAGLQERNLSALLDRVQSLKPSHVYLQATADTDGDGVADAAYFPNRHLPLRADLFNRAAWQLTSRVDVKVYAVMPVSGFHLPQAAVAEIYEDLARHAHFAGLVFDDGLRPAGIEDLEFTRRLAQGARVFRAPLKTVRTTMRGQDVPAFAAEYDYVALVADAELPAVDPDLRGKVVFMLRNAPPPHDAKLLARRMRALQLGGALNFGYVHDDFLHDSPPLAQIAPAMSLREYPLAVRAGDKR